MKTKDDNKKIHNYGNGQVRCIAYLPGGMQAAIAEAEGFRWTGSTDTHDVFTNHLYRTQRCINKETKRFYEQRL